MAVSVFANMSIEHPKFVPYKGPITGFFEQFIDNSDWKSRWVISKAKKNHQFSYIGKWAVEEAYHLPALEGDKGLVLKSSAAHHAISTLFKDPFDNLGKTLVLQYEVKLQKGLECGGAYIKLISNNNTPHDFRSQFNSNTSYLVMFGPDKCGATNKIHLIIRRPTPNGTYEEKHLTRPPQARLNKLTNLYTLIIRPGNDFEIRVNGNVVKTGNLLEESTFMPSFNPPKEIEDINDSKPEDWVDEEFIPNPEQSSKPDDWDEDAPYKIDDPNSFKPDDWDESMPEYIPDPEAKRPDYWDDLEDGEWVAPEILNPECENHGCGPWVPPKIVNQNYKGKWSQPLIPNPNFKGHWAPAKIPNPDYREDTKASDLELIAGIGFELWTMQEDILFTNIYLGHSVEEAEAIGNATFVIKSVIEADQEKSSDSFKTEFANSDDYKPKKFSSMDMFLADPVSFLFNKFVIFLEAFATNPFEAIKHDPLVASISFVFVLVCAATIFGLLNVILFFLFGKKKQVANKVISETDESDGNTKAKSEGSNAEPEVSKASGLENTASGLKKRS